MNLNLAGKAAIVTGASRGMGKAIALRLAAEGAKLVICSRSQAAIDEVAREIAHETGNQPVAVACDLADPAAIERLVEKAQDTLGGVDILVSNAGGPSRSAFMDIPDDEWSAWFNLTFMSFVRLTRAVIPIMEQRGGGHILTIGSNSAIQPIASFSLSNALRAGVLGLVRSLVDETAGKNIRVTTLSPGRIATERFRRNSDEKARRAGVALDQVVADAQAAIPLGRLGTPEEIADLVSFMVSDRASYLTGTNILLDGGLTAAARPS